MWHVHVIGTSTEAGARDHILYCTCSTGTPAESGSRSPGACSVSSTGDAHSASENDNSRSGESKERHIDLDISEGGEEGAEKV